MELSFNKLEKEIHAEDYLFKDIEVNLDLAEANILNDFEKLKNIEKGVESKGFEGALLRVHGVYRRDHEDMILKKGVIITNSSLSIILSVKGLP